MPLWGEPSPCHGPQVVEICARRQHVGVPREAPVGTWRAFFLWPFRFGPNKLRIPQALRQACLYGENQALVMVPRWWRSARRQHMGVPREAPMPSRGSSLTFPCCSGPNELRNLQGLRRACLYGENQPLSRGAGGGDVPVGSMSV